MRVKAKAAGFYGDCRIYPGDELTLRDKDDFSPKWMERLEPDVAEEAMDNNAPVAIPLPNLNDVANMSYDELGAVIKAYGIEGASRSGDERIATVTAYLEGLAG